MARSGRTRLYHLTVFSKGCSLGQLKNCFSRKAKRFRIELERSFHDIVWTDALVFFSLHFLTRIYKFFLRWTKEMALRQQTVRDSKSICYRPSPGQVVIIPLESQDLQKNSDKQNKNGNPLKYQTCLRYHNRSHTWLAATVPQTQNQNGKSV